MHDKLKPLVSNTFECGIQLQALGLGHETWSQDGGNVRPRNVASESEESASLRMYFLHLI